MGCGGSRARASTPVAGDNSQPGTNQNGRFDSAPVNGSQGNKPVRDLQSASTVMIGEQSNTNLNNNNGPNNTQANVLDDDKISTSSSKVMIGHKVSTASSDSVFDRKEAVDTHTQENVVETPAAHSMQLEESANQESSETEQTEGEGEKASLEQTDGAAGEDNAARPPSSVSRMEIDESNSVSQLPKIIVKKSVNAAIKRLSLHEDPSSDDDDAETNVVNEKQSEAAPQENQVQQIAEGEEMKESQPEVPHDEGVDKQEEEVKEVINDGDVTTESQNVQKDITTKSEEVETAKASVTAIPQSEEGGTSEDAVHGSSSTTNTTANEDSSNDQEPPAAVEANGEAGVEGKAPEDEPATEQEAPVSDGNVAENNTDNQAGDVGVTGPTQVEEKNDSKEADGGSSKTPEEVAPSGSGDESATPPETQNEQ